MKQVLKERKGSLRDKKKDSQKALGASRTRLHCHIALLLVTHTVTHTRTVHTHTHTYVLYTHTHTQTNTHTLTIYILPAATIKASPALQKAEQLTREGEEAEGVQDYQAALQCYIKAVELMLPVAEGADTTVERSYVY